MQQFTIEIARTLPTDELFSIVWDMYKEINGHRPRHFRRDDRETFISFLEYELNPDVQALRWVEWQEESARFAKIEAEWAEEDRARREELAEQERVAAELAAAYDDRYDHLE